MWRGGCATQRAFWRKWSSLGGSLRQ
ncbi:hypothetical protein NCLIV_038310 [Neospora caninum Liverpool]|uniref:Uncharacterized protein n=1 Tax=Neospora caninum (strain Liverpool) TaxID=572307 RepID=F0VCD2_NEOCL|nr:hypothetical protein NCLIV_038310 [Neospora caninum Liverpool]CEL68055.1 TPA: hypothetical protein BN1204_038310 [Neospora caninum Liverpool]